MDKADSDDLLDQVDRHFDSANQAWLLGAGISVDAGLPLMNGLTIQVRELAKDKPHEALLENLMEELPAGSHIEHALSQLVDYSTIASRMAASNVNIGGETFTRDDLEQAHATITKHIATTIRWGYIAESDNEPAVVGTAEKPLAQIGDHTAFVRALFEKRQAGLSERRRPIRFFTINYDTLLEDALALGNYTYWDGFSGGAVAFRNYEYGAVPDVDGKRAMLVKLHGSIDWASAEGKVYRIRDSDTYPNRRERVLIYPQSTKYISTQRDPFAAQFDVFRRTLGSADELVLSVVGYSFSDEHINEEIERALLSDRSKVTLIVFCRENNSLPECLKLWLDGPRGEQVFVLTEKCAHWGTKRAAVIETDTEHNWWTFKGVIDLLATGGRGDE